MKSETEWIDILFELIEKLMALLKDTVHADQAQEIYDHYLKP